ncbi:MAG: alanine--tRNA ligase [Planctomycetota bacterium]
MKVNELRSRYLEFFKEKKHLIQPSASLVPLNDPSLLFTGAGMNQFKDYFLGRVAPPSKRITTSQKCLRTVDIEKVGRTVAHHTFFEMLGNFSFGDYFKKETITWAWEFLLNELKLPADQLYVSIYTDDREAYDLWHKIVGLPVEKIFKLGEASNFWPANAPSQGPNGPCGPCSEIFYDRGAEYGCGLPTCSVACDCNRFVEIWNLVFMQFNRQEDGTLKPLPQKNIDTGMGLERIAMVIQNVSSTFEIDIFRTIIKNILEVTKLDYHPQTEEGSRIKRIADHIRALVFLVADGVLPSNEGRGYVERRLLRRAFRDGMTLGLSKPFLYQLVPIVVQVMKRAYPELPDKETDLIRIIKSEENKFLETVEQGMTLLEKTIKDLSNRNEKRFPGEAAFKLYDTYGFPVDLTESILAEKGFKLDLLNYEEAMSRQKERARQSSKISQAVFASTPINEIKGILHHTEFIGYQQTVSPVKIEAIIADGALVNESEGNQEITIVTEKTPFYAESGGQVADTGSFKGPEVEVKITDTQRLENYILHIGKIKKGILRTGIILQAEVDSQRRQAIARNHTATHLLQNALRKILGEHLKQSGSLVAPDRLRFDYTHFSAPTRDELNSVEDYVNQRIMENAEVSSKETSLTQAKKLGALSFFGEKYGDNVRLVGIGDYSKELCGGTHLKNTGTIGYFKINNEHSIASGVRRIEAITGPEVLKKNREQTQRLEQVCELLNTAPNHLVEKIKALQQELKTAQQSLLRQAKQDNQEIARSLLNRTASTNNVKIIAEIFENKTMDELRTIADILRNSSEQIVALLGSTDNQKANLVLTMSENLVRAGFDSVSILKETAKLIGGSGGGRKNLSQAGGKNISKLNESMDYFVKMVTERLE